MELSQVVLSILLQHRGPGEKISRAALLGQVNQQTGMTWRDDKPVRDAVNWLRSNDPVGCYIVSSLDGGTFIARSREEANSYMLPDWSRVNRIRERLQAQDKLLAMNDAPAWVQETKQMELAL